MSFWRPPKKSLKKLDRPWQQAILDYLENEVPVLADPRSRGKALTGEKRGLWRYRVGDYRIICHIEDSRLTILAWRSAIAARCTTISPVRRSRSLD